MSVCRCVCVALHLLAAPTVVCHLPPSLSLSRSHVAALAFLTRFLLWFIFCRLPDFRFLNAPSSAAVCPSTRLNPPPFPLHTCVCVCVSVLHYQCVCLETRSLKQIYCHSLCTAVNFFSLSFCFTSLSFSTSLFLLAVGQVLNGMVNGTTRRPWQSASGECKLPRLASTRAKPSNRWTAALIGTLTRKTGCIMQNPLENRGATKKLPLLIALFFAMALVIIL